MVTVEAPWGEYVSCVYACVYKAECCVCSMEVFPLKGYLTNQYRAHCVTGSDTGRPKPLRVSFLCVRASVTLCCRSRGTRGCKCAVGHMHSCAGRG